MTNRAEELLAALKKTKLSGASLALTSEWADLRNYLQANPHTLSRMFDMVCEFNGKIVGLEPPEQPGLLDPLRMDFRLNHMREELVEALDSAAEGDLSGVVDGLLDLIYVALGTLMEMGVAPGAAFEEVHAANMTRVRGEQSRRPGSRGHDAVKPPGWKPPDLKPYLRLTRDDVQFLENSRVRVVLGAPVEFDPVDELVFNFTDIFLTDEEIPPKQPKVLVLGHARHGKDTVGRMLRDKYGLDFVSSSMFCAEHVVMPAMIDLKTPGQRAYDTVQECYDDRANHRAEWFNIIRGFNTPDATALGRAIFEKHDVYCGLRSRAEFHALRNANLFDVAIWVDRSECQLPEDRSSCTVEPWMADFIVDNNGTLEDLGRNLQQLMDTLQYARCVDLSEEGLL